MFKHKYAINPNNERNFGLDNFIQKIHVAHFLILAHLAELLVFATQLLVQLSPQIPIQTMIF